MLRGTPVESLHKALRPGEAPKLLALRGLRSFEDEDSNWALDQVLKKMRLRLHNVEVADIALPSYRVLSNVSNDPDDTLFAPEDQFPVVFEALKRSDIVVLATREYCGFPSADTVRLFERLHERAKMKDDAESPSPSMLFDNKSCAVIVVGDYGAYHAALSCAGVLSKTGMTLVRHGLVFHDVRRGGVEKAKEFVGALDQLAGDIADLCQTFAR